MSSRDASGRNRPHGSGSTSKARPESAGTFQRLQSRGERLLQWFPELRKALLREGEPGIDALVAQLQSLRGQVSKRAQETGRDLEDRAERILAELERQTVRGLRPLLTRANVASHSAVETLERRIAHLEGRLGPLLDDRSQVSGRVGALERQVEEVRADASERLREITLQLSNEDEVRAELNELRGHLDALSKDQVTRSLELGKQHDRLVRLEMRFGDFLKDHATQVVEQEQVKKRLAAAEHAVEDSARVIRTAADAAAASATAARETAERLTTIGSDTARQRDELTRAVEQLGDLQRVMRQLELRLGDLGERHGALREELAGLAARVSHLELTAAQRGAPPALASTVEGH
jgi:predicted  nucleic acid-binding Zn-ribbon protein